MGGFTNMIDVGQMQTFADLAQRFGIDPADPNASDKLRQLLLQKQMQQPAMSAPAQEPPAVSSPSRSAAQQILDMFQRGAAERDRLRAQSPQDTYKTLWEQQYGPVAKSGWGRALQGMLQGAAAFVGAPQPDLRKAALEQWKAQQAALNSEETTDARLAGTSLASLLSQDTARERNATTLEAHGMDNATKERINAASLLLKQEVEKRKAEIAKIEADAKARGIDAKIPIEQKKAAIFDLLQRIEMFNQTAKTSPGAALQLLPQIMPGQDQADMAQAFDADAASRAAAKGAGQSQGSIRQQLVETTVPGMGTIRERIPMATMKLQQGPAGKADAYSTLYGKFPTQPAPAQQAQPSIAANPLAAMRPVAPSAPASLDDLEYTGNDVPGGPNAAKLYFRSKQDKEMFTPKLSEKDKQDQQNAQKSINGLISQAKTMGDVIATGQDEGKQFGIFARTVDTLVPNFTNDLLRFTGQPVPDSETMRKQAISRLSTTVLADYIKQISGVQVSHQEFDRLKTAFPKGTDDPRYFATLSYIAGMGGAVALKFKQWGIEGMTPRLPFDRVLMDKALEYVKGLEAQKLENKLKPAEKRRAKEMPQYFDANQLATEIMQNAKKSDGSPMFNPMGEDVPVYNGMMRLHIPSPTELGRDMSKRKKSNDALDLLRQAMQ